MADLHSILEGRCPTCGTVLDRRERDGWCPTCQVGWASTWHDGEGTVTLTLEAETTELKSSLGRITKPTSDDPTSHFDSRTVRPKDRGATADG